MHAYPYPHTICYATKNGYWLAIYNDSSTLCNVWDIEIEEFEWNLRILNSNRSKGTEKSN